MTENKIDPCKNVKALKLAPIGELTGYAHPKCYANKTNNCSTKISREHYISNNILANFEENKVIKIVGLPWLEHDRFHLLSRKKLVANILCTSHNGMLSKLDSDMGHLFKTLINFDNSFNNDVSESTSITFSGDNLEKWMMKTICGFIAAKIISKEGTKQEYELNENLIEILYNDAPLPNGWGLYCSPNDQTEFFPSISFLPILSEDELKGAEFLINNIKFYFLLHTPDRPDSFGMHRPMGLQFKDKEVIKTIEFCWENKAYGDGLFFDRVGTKPNAPSDWEEYLRK